MNNIKPATPLPWFVDYTDAEGRTVSTIDHRAIAECGLDYSRIKGGGKANAAYIVAACNAYPELVAALKRTTAALGVINAMAVNRPMMESHVVTEAQTCGGALNEARTLLAKLGEV